jgi:hypothetical protein
MHRDHHALPARIHASVRRVGLAFIGAILIPHVPVAAQTETDTYYEHKRSGIELTALYGYQFGGQVDLTTGGEIKLDDQDAFGFILGVPLGGDPSAQVELSYSHQATTVLSQDYFQTNETPLFDMSVDYFQVGGSRGVRRGKAMPFGFGSIGATMFNPKGDDPDAEWRFSITLGVGAKYYLSERTGIRAQFGLLIPMQWSEGSLWCGSGGCAGGVSGGTTFGQGNVSGGLIFLF